MDPSSPPHSTPSSTSVQERFAKEGFKYMILFLVADTIAFQSMKRLGIVSAKSLRAWSLISNGIGASGIAYVGYCKFKAQELESQFQDSVSLEQPAQPQK